MMRVMAAALDDLLKTAEHDDRVLAVLLYGSRARGDSRLDSDTDICLVVPAAISREAAVQVSVDYLRFSALDVRVFQLLPLYIRQRVLKDGQVLLSKKNDELYEIAFRTIRSWEDFRPFYLEYLKQVANG